MGLIPRARGLRRLHAPLVAPEIKAPEVVHEVPPTVVTLVTPTITLVPVETTMHYHSPLLIADRTDH